MQRILFVDDEPKILTGLCRSLRGARHAWEMVFAEGGAAALDQLASAPFDVVVSDARMPGMEGSELLARVAQQYPDTGRVILSGQCSRKSVLKCVGVAHQFLNKPCEAETLKEALRKLCQVRESFRDERSRKDLSGMQRLPSQGSVNRELNGELASPDPSLERVAATIARDVGLSALVVQLVSSGFFGSPQRVTNAAEAANLLGLDTIKALWELDAGLSSGNAELLQPALEELNQHSLAVARAAQRIATTLTSDRELIGDGHLAGLLHEVGTLAITCGNAEPAWDSAGSHELSDAGEEWNCVSHAGLARPDPGGYLAGLWGLPDSVVDAISHRRDPSRAPDPTSVPLVALHTAHAMLDQNRYEPCGACSWLA